MAQNESEDGGVKPPLQIALDGPGTRQWATYSVPLQKVGERVACIIWAEWLS